MKMKITILLIVSVFFAGPVLAGRRARERPSRSASNRTRQSSGSVSAPRAAPSAPSPRVARPVQQAPHRLRSERPGGIARRNEPVVRENRETSSMFNRILRRSQPVVRENREFEVSSMFNRRPRVFSRDRSSTRDINANRSPVIARPAPDSSRHRGTGLDSHRDQSRRRSRFFDNLDFGSAHSFGFRREDRDHHDHQRGRGHLHYYREGYPSRRIFHRIVWPSYRHTIYYDYGPHYTFGYYWPYYHRRYLFVSLGGWWPDYDCVRYYWYPSHRYVWYGYDPVEYVIERGDTYNYYTYNYYYDRLKPGEVIGGVEVPDYDALSEVRKKLEEKPPEKPAEETQADRCFDDGVKSFEAGDYAAAVAKFQDALELAPDDIVLPFAYVQALFANGEYGKATEVLREALSKAEPQKEGVFYPRGLYTDDDVLNKQIEQLDRTVKLTADADLQLLLGYQLLGMGRLDEALEPLEKAQKDCDNKQAATLLMTLLEKLKNAEENKLTSEQNK